MVDELGRDLKEQKEECQYLRRDHEIQKEQCHAYLINIETLSNEVAYITNNLNRCKADLEESEETNLHLI